MEINVDVDDTVKPLHGIFDIIVLSPLIYISDNIHSCVGGTDVVSLSCISCNCDYWASHAMRTGLVDYLLGGHPLMGKRGYIGVHLSVKLFLYSDVVCDNSFRFDYCCLIKTFVLGLAIMMTVVLL